MDIYVYVYVHTLDTYTYLRLYINTLVCKLFRLIVFVLKSEKLPSRQGKHKH